MEAHGIVRLHEPPPMTTASVATLVHESLGERVYNSLRDLILSQAYPPRVHTAPGTAQRGRVVPIEAAPFGRR
jgi:hypothetical protein